MQDLTKYIDNIVYESSTQINDKVLGVNFLEKLKYLLIDKIKLFNKNFIKNIENYQNNKTAKKYGENYLLIKVKTNSDSVSTIKNIVSNDYLSIVVHGSKSLKIYENSSSKKSFFLNCVTNTGIVISKDTVISESISKNTILLDIINIKDNINVEN